MNNKCAPFDKLILCVQVSLTYRIVIDKWRGLMEIFAAFLIYIPTSLSLVK